MLGTKALSQISHGFAGGSGNYVGLLIVNTFGNLAVATMSLGFAKCAGVRVSGMSFSINYAGRRLATTIVMISKA